MIRHVKSPVPLKPCPFCGGEAEMIQDTDEFVPGKIAVTAYIVKCSKCWAAPLPNNYEGKKEAAAARWNRRIEACG